MTDQNGSDNPIRLTELLSQEARELLTASGKSLIKQIGVDVMRGVVFDVLTGRNIRNSTEILTRRRIAALNLATFNLFLQASTLIDNFIERLPYIASDTLSAGRISKEERWLAQWILGLTDIGFIGRGNTEISLDKVSRYRREILLGRENWYMATIIIVDRIGARSNIEKLARNIDGTIVQMSAGYWPQRVARILNQILGFEHPLVSMDQAEIGDFLKAKLHDAPLDSFIDVTLEG